MYFIDFDDNYLPPDDRGVFIYYIKPFSHQKILSLMREDNLTVEVFFILRQLKFGSFTYPPTYFFVSSGEDASIYDTLLGYKYVYYWLPKGAEFPEEVPFSDALNFLNNYRAYYAKKFLKEFREGDVVFVPRLGVYGEVLERLKANKYLVQVPLMNRLVPLEIKQKDLVGV